jgi:hypothetical protein
MENSTDLPLQHKFCWSRSRSAAGRGCRDFFGGGVVPLWRSAAESFFDPEPPPFSLPPAAAPAKCEQPPNALDLGLVVVRDTGTIKGLGVFAAADLEAQTFFGEYTGEVLTAKEYARRYPRADAEYVLEVNDDYSIDAGDPLLSPGPVRYANHSRSVCQHPKSQTLCNLPPAPRDS